MQVLILYMSLSMFQHSEKKMLCLVSNIYLLLASFARSVRQVMDRVFSFLLWPKREARGP